MALAVRLLLNENVDHEPRSLSSTACRRVFSRARPRRQLTLSGPRPFPISADAVHHRGKDGGRKRHALDDIDTLKPDCVR
jgi:hypothetical protein